MRKESLGIIYKLLSILGYSTIALINKGEIGSLNTLQIFFLSSLSCLIFVTAIIKIQRKESLISLAKSTDKTYLIIALTNVISFCATLYAIKTLDITVAISIGYLTPILVSVFAVQIFKERFSYKIGFALLLGICASVIVAKPMLTDKITTLGVGAAFISAIGWALHGLILKKQTMKDHWTKQTFLTLILTTSISFPFVILHWQPLTTSHLLILFKLGALYTLSKMFLVKGVVRTPLTLLVPIGFTKLMFTATFARLLFGEIISINTIVGSSLLILSTLIVLHSTRQLAPIEPRPEEAS